VASPLNLPTINPILDGLNWILSLSSSDTKNLKEEIEELIADLSKSLRGLWNITREISNFPDENLERNFPCLYTHFKCFYYGNEAFQAVRTHCSSLQRDLDRVRFKVSFFIRADLGKWKDANNSLQFGLLNDINYENDYRQNYENLNTRLSEINESFRGGHSEQASQLFTLLKKDLQQDLDYLHNHIKVLEDTNEHIRINVG
jgi:hypothetical protein